MAVKSPSRTIAVMEWFTGGLTVMLAVIAWLQTTPGANIYDIFPVFGLIAFGLMWTHFIFGAVRKYYKVESKEGSPFQVSSMAVVLMLIILHPGLLWYGLYRDGFGLPPLSTLQVYSSEAVYILMGLIGLTIFLTYELRRSFQNSSWWRYVEQAQIVGMVLIFVHALMIGGTLSIDWYRAIWWLYGVLLFTSVVYAWWHNRVHNKEL